MLLLRLTAANNWPSISSVKLGSFNDVIFGINPINVVSGVVNGETIGPVHVGGGQMLPHASVHGSTSEVGHPAPVGPEHKSRKKPKDYLLTSKV